MASAWLARRRFQGERRVYAYRWLSRALAQSLSLDVVLNNLAMFASDDGNHPGNPAAMAFTSWGDRARAGATLGRAMRGWVPPSHAMMIEAGEAAQNVSRALEICGYLEESEMRMKRAIRGAIAYPAVLGVMLIALIYMCATHVIPQFEFLVPMERWTGLAAMLPMVFDFVLGWGLTLAGVGAALLAFGLGFGLARWVGRLRDTCDRFIVFREYRVFQGTLFLVGLTQLMRSRIALDVAMDLLGRHAMPWLSYKVDKINRRLRQGLSLPEAMWAADPDFPDRGLNREFRMVMSLGRGFEEEVERMATLWVDGTVERFDKFGATMRSLMVALNGLVLGFMVAAMAQLSRQAVSTMGAY